MMHANKMVLVPANEMSAQQMLPPIVPQLVNLDSEIRNVLETPNIPADVKLVNYNQVLRRYMKLHHDLFDPSPQIPSQPIASQPTKNLHEPQADVQDNAITQVSDATILRNMPKKNHNSASALLEFVKNIPELKWNNKGEMIIDGQRVSNTNIVDLIHDFSRSRKRPPAEGAIQLAAIMKKYNIPRECIGNDERWRIIEHSRQNLNGVTPVSTGKRSEFSTPLAATSGKKQRKRLHRSGRITGEWEEDDGF